MTIPAALDSAIASMDGVPTVGVFIGDAPEDRHAERVVGEMLKYLERIAAQADPALNAVLGGRRSAAASRRRRGLSPSSRRRNRRLCSTSPTPSASAAGSPSASACGKSTTMAARPCGGIRRSATARDANRGGRRRCGGSAGTRSRAWSNAAAATTRSGCSPRCRPWPPR